MNAGYIFNFGAHGAFDPNGKIEVELTQDQIDAHNRRLSAEEMKQLRETGKGVLYLFTKKEESSNRHIPHQAGTWASSEDERIKINNYRTSRNNFGARRIDVWFYLDGRLWHGVNIGDNEILRVKRNKN